MGCDIHFFIERYSSDDYEGPKDISEERNTKLTSILPNMDSIPARWITDDKWVPDEDDYDDGIPWTIDRNSRLYRGRNYYLFGVLAGVRGTGPTISEPRGVPEDASFAYMNELKRWDGDYHSESYFTLKELLDVDWDKYHKDDWLDEFMETIEKMKKIDPDPTKVRCVFFFDN